MYLCGDGLALHHRGECELKPSKREETLESIAFTLNHIWLQDRRCKRDDVRGKKYPQQEEEDTQMPMAAEEQDARP